jgi:hypothetical protein
MRRRFARTFTAFVLVSAAASLACASRKDETTVNPMSKLGSDRYIQKAIRSSNEGVILLPSSKAERVYELPRLNEIAHSLREPAAECFLRRAIEVLGPRGGDLNASLAAAAHREGPHGQRGRWRLRRSLCGPRAAEDAAPEAGSCTRRAGRDRYPPV